MEPQRKGTDSRSTAKRRTERESVQAQRQIF